MRPARGFSHDGVLRGESEGELERYESLCFLSYQAAMRFKLMASREFRKTTNQISRIFDFLVSIDL